MTREQVLPLIQGKWKFEKEDKYFEIEGEENIINISGIKYPDGTDITEENFELVYDKSTDICKIACGNVFGVSTHGHIAECTEDMFLLTFSSAVSQNTSISANMAPIRFVRP